MSNIALLEGRLNEKVVLLQKDLAVKQLLQKQLADKQTELNLILASVLDHEEAAVVIAMLEKTQQAQLKEKLEKIVSYALSVIFERKYTFLIDFEQRGQQSDALLKVMDEHGNAQELKDAHGGGLQVVVAFILRAIVMMSTQPPLTPILIDDEPMVQVSAEYRGKLIEFLRTLAEKAKVQLLMVTHSDDFLELADKCYRFRLVSGKTEVTCIK